MKIIELDEVDSTNEYIKRSDISCDAAVIARRQTAGRGTKGRSFVSDEGGLYISVVRFYNNLSAGDAFKIMVNHCVAVCKTLENFNLKPVIRWANDVLVNGKKICGTLIENTVRGNKIVRSIVGIGINVNNRFTGDLNNIATSITQHVSAKISVDDVKYRLLGNLGKDYTINDYKSYINWFGSRVKIFADGAERQATALDVLGDGRLSVKEEDGSLSEISSAEVGLRLLCKEF